MNLILFEPGEIGKPIPRGDRRYSHITNVLRLSPGDGFDAGILNGPTGRALVTGMTDREIRFEFTPGTEPPPLFPVTLLLGFPRPICARRILKDLTTLGVERILLCGTDKGEKSYRESRIWTAGEYRDHLREGAEQAWSTRLPEVSFHWSVRAALGSVPDDAVRIALDNYESEVRLSRFGPIPGRCVLAIGSERGWSDAEREVLRGAGFRIADLGPRVLRTETACLSAVTLALAAMNLM
jgi:16S rRNA (uracil1498-N3)-methyltransferase